MTYRDENTGRFAKCPECEGKRYLVATRDDGRIAIERCDACSSHLFSDEDAAILAIRDGYDVRRQYPCIVRNPLIYAREKRSVRLWELIKRRIRPLA